MGKKAEKWCGILKTNMFAMFGISASTTLGAVISKMPIEKKGWTWSRQGTYTSLYR